MNVALKTGDRKMLQKAVISTEGRNLALRGHRYYIYLVTNKNDNVMYVGVTNDLERRVHGMSTR